MAEHKEKLLEELERILRAAQSLGLNAVEITSGSLAKRAGVLNAMPSVCNAMRQKVKTGDAEIRRPTVQENSSTNLFRYQLPR